MADENFQLFFNQNQLDFLKKKKLNTTRKLLLFFPTRYIDRSSILDLQKSKIGDIVTLLAVVKSSRIIYGKRRTLQVMVDYQNMGLSFVFFSGIAYYQKILSLGTMVAFSGKLQKFAGRLCIVHPEVEVIQSEELVHTGKIIPIYKISESFKKVFLTARKIREVIYSLLKSIEGKILDHLDESFLKKHNLLPLESALYQMHFPNSLEEANEAKRRFAFEEILSFLAIVKEKKIKNEKLVKHHLLKTSPDKKIWAEQVARQLPFALTADQKKAILQIKEKIYSHQKFAVLLQGDVGSGKTIVSLLTALEYAEEGLQVAFLVPTEILARQHYLAFLNACSKLPFVQIDLLIGKEKLKEKKLKLDRIQRGDVQIVIGTHALIQKDVVFQNLAYIIIDEQHRFGVEQREQLHKKGKTPDVLAMTATPIPRSLSLTLFKDMDSLFLKEKPQDRIPIITKIFPDTEIEKIYRGVKKYVDMGQQAFIIYPQIGEDDQLEAETLNNSDETIEASEKNIFKNQFKSLMTDYKELENIHFVNYRLGLLHGRLSSLEKDLAMEKFKDKSIQILIATTVIEVGIDIPNASVIVIRDADKFGLSQLHQLRGRVGRGKNQSYCILVYSENITEEGRQRLKAMEESNDGFYLAQKDLEFRGIGEMMGMRQAGQSEFKIADLKLHLPLVELAQECLNQDSDLYIKILKSNSSQILDSGNSIFI